MSPSSDASRVPALRVDDARVALAGTLAWVLALVVTLLVPALHSGGRGWWPMACAAGIALGLLGHARLRRAARLASPTTSAPAGADGRARR